MSELLLAKDGQVYTGYDNLTGPQFCTPTFLGCSACIGASVVDGSVVLTVNVNTPFGSVTKGFRIGGGGSFTWQPFSKFKAVISINNFSEQGGSFSFDAGIQVCLDAPFFGWKCAGYSYHFSIPGGHLLKAAAEPTDAEFTNQLILQLLLEKQTEKCNCH